MAPKRRGKGKGRGQKREPNGVLNRAEIIDAVHTVGRTSVFLMYVVTGYCSLFCWVRTIFQELKSRPPRLLAQCMLFSERLKWSIGQVSIVYHRAMRAMCCKRRRTLDILSNAIECSYHRRKRKGIVEFRASSLTQRRTRITQVDVVCPCFRTLNPDRPLA